MIIFFLLKSLFSKTIPDSISVQSHSDYTCKPYYFLFVYQKVIAHLTTILTYCNDIR